MLNSVILTVKAEWAGIEYDIEFPANVPAGDLCARLLAVLKSIEADKFSDIDKIALIVTRSGKQLGDEETLESAEVWDGNTVTVLK